MLAKQELFEAHLQSILGWLFWRWGLKNYLPRLAFNRDPISDSQVTRITGVTHWHLARVLFYYIPPFHNPSVSWSNLLKLSFHHSLVRVENPDPNPRKYSMNE
jgi:hypothetical protein